MRTHSLLSAAALAALVTGTTQGHAQYVDLYTLNAYCNAGYYDACAALNAYQMQAQAQAGYGAGYGGGHDPYAAHSGRMQQIHNWGNQMLANGAANSAILDQRHNSFMETLRN